MDIKITTNFNFKTKSVSQSVHDCLYTLLFIVWNNNDSEATRTRGNQTNMAEQ